VIPMEPWFVTACAVTFGAKDDQFLGIVLLIFTISILSLLHSAGGFTRGFDDQDGVALP
jgi:hypothetical protein